MNEIETLIVRRAAEMAEKDGVGVQIVHVFGATSQLSAALAEARDRLINHPGQIADTLAALFDAEAAAGEDEDLDPVEAARKAADEAQTTALEAAQRADELTAVADQLQAQKEADEAAAAEAAAAAAQTEGEPAAPEQEQTGSEDAEAPADAPVQEQEAAAPAAKPTRKAK